MKKTFKNKVDNNPYEGEMKGNCVYFEEKPKLLFKSNQNNTSSKKSSSRENFKLPKLEIPLKPKDEGKNEAISRENNEKLLLIKKIYGLKHFKASDNIVKKLGKCKSTQRYQDFSSICSISRTRNDSCRTSNNKERLPTVASFFKNDEFYYFNTNV